MPIGYVGVVVSYYGKEGADLSGEAFRHGERVAEGARGVQAKTLCPGKYPFNTYAGHVHPVPTTNFVLHWITGRTEESHRYDETLKSIDLVTADAYEPVLPLSVVVHIDYQKAPSVVQRFGDIKKLITQTLDPHAQRLLPRHRPQEDDARAAARPRPDPGRGPPRVAAAVPGVRHRAGRRPHRQARHGGRRRPDRDPARAAAAAAVGPRADRDLRAAAAAAEKLQTLKMAQAQADKQTELTNSHVEIQIAANRGEAELAQARKRAEQTVVTAQAENQRQVLVAEAEGKARTLVGEGQSKRVSMEGEAEANVLRQKVASYGDPKLYALSLVTEFLSHSQQPLVPQHLFVTGGDGDKAGSLPAQGLLGTLLSLLIAEKANGASNLTT